MDLWPEDVNQPLEIKSPYSIILEQCKLLGDKTANIVEAKVQKLKQYSQYKDFVYGFYLVSPITNYKYRLFTFFFNIEMYPVEFRMDEEIIPDIPPEFSNGSSTESVKVGFVGKTTLFAENKEMLFKLLKIIFNSEKTKKIISAIYEMSHEYF